MKKLITTLLIATLISCSTESSNRTANTDCNCIEVREYALQSENYETWSQISIRETDYSCSMDNYTEFLTQYFNPTINDVVRERIRISCE